MPQPSDMKGRAALVTGAAGGLGAATALRLAQAGADVCLVDIDAARLEETAAAARAHGVKALVRATDLSERENCTAAVTAAVEAFGRLDALCNVAAILITEHAADMPAASWEKTLAVNLSAPFYLIQAAIPHLLEADGAVVNVTSCAAHKAQAYSAAYCATKAGLSHMTKALAMEFMHKPIRFNAVAPGGMMTNIARNMRLPEDFDRALFGRVNPLRGLVEVDEVAELVAFLATPASAAYHGASINIDKGITAD
ncbi:SDR family NAD(P)-dependent oxidoreductase [Phenylobacterium sp. LjRoot219]|uniref:SDR family NAD(P)-dependent oxidoreductase n=1 Tax=Phenylobacterium sp. LjRoot219 TaxID=3342283 RepID=UPI003ECD6660